MKRSLKVLSAVSVFALSMGMSRVVRAEEKKEMTRAQYLQELQLKLDHAAHRANQPNAEGSTVAGLRGSKQESGSKQLYWKGKEGRTPVAPEEIKAFRAAVEQARAGKDAEAQAAL